MSKKFTDHAAGAFMQITVSLSTWAGVAQLKKGAAVAANDAHANPEAARMYVNVLGAQHSKLKAVRAAYAAIRTYLYANTLPFSKTEPGQQVRGPRLIPTCQVPVVWVRLQEMVQVAQDALDDFLPEYDRLVTIAQSYDLGDWRSEVIHPSVDEVRRKFAAVVSTPKSIVPREIETAMLPAAMAKEFAAANEQELADQLEVAKEAAMKQATDQMDVLVTQLRNGKRLHDSLISNSLRIGQMLRDITAGYDNDPRLIALADLIAEKVAHVPNAEEWNTYPHKRAESLRAAETVSKGLKDLAAVPSPAAANKLQASSVVAGGMLADLLD
jgi:hypothetical protein